MRVSAAFPFSCAVEKSFSLHKKIRTDSRNRICTKNVRKVVYCHWNGRLSEPADLYRNEAENITAWLFTGDMKDIFDEV